MRLAGKVAFISGGASGLGEAIVHRFTAEGSQTFFGDVDVTRGEMVARESGAVFILLDVAQEGAWERAMALVEREVGRLDILVNNAGILGTPAFIEDLDLDDWNRVMAIHVTGVMLGCKHGARLMRKNPGGPSGSIVNMSSVAGIMASPGPGYPTSKGAVRLMTKAIAADFAFAGIPIRCNSIHPGAIDTPIFDVFRHSTAEQITAMKESLDLQIPMGRLGRPEEIAAMALFLASDESSFSTGAEFVADGGGTATFASPRKGSWMEKTQPDKTV